MFFDVLLDARGRDDLQYSLRISVPEGIGDASSGVRRFHKMSGSEVWEVYRRTVLAVLM
jgi:hypothetical protein